MHDIKSKLIIPPNATAAEAAVKVYNNVLVELANKHAPMQYKNVIIRPKTTWYTEEIREEKIKRWKLERQWQKSGLEVHREIFALQHNKITKLVKESKSQHYTDLVTDAKDQKKLFCITSKLLNKSKCSRLPSSTNNTELSELFFSEFFHHKISGIWQQIEDDQQSLDCFERLLAKCNQSLSSFMPATEDDIC